MEYILDTGSGKWKQTGTDPAMLAVPNGVIYKSRNFADDGYVSVLSVSGATNTITLGNGTSPVAVSGVTTLTLNGATTSPDVLLALANTADSTALATIHVSPALRLSGTGYDADDGVTRDVDLELYALPVSANTVFARFVFRRRTAGGAWVEVGRITEGRSGADVVGNYSLVLGGFQCFGVDGAGNLYPGSVSSGIYITGSTVRLDTASGTMFEANAATLAFYGGTKVAKPAITGALSGVADANAKNVLTSIIAALKGTTGVNLATDSTT